MIAASALIVNGLPQPAQALPFKKNCASMQNYVNALKWNVPTRFSNFENAKMYDFSSPRPSFQCEGGYITESSPMGTKVCQGQFDIWNPDGRWRSEWSAKQNACRWK